MAPDDLIRSLALVAFETEVVEACHADSGDHQAVLFLDPDPALVDAGVEGHLAQAGATVPLLVPQAYEHVGMASLIVIWRELCSPFELFVIFTSWRATQSSSSSPS
jgi:hypothetical protein